MKNLRSPWWILGISSLPILLLLAIYGGIFWIISPQLPPNALALWLTFAIWLGSYGFIQAIFAIYCISAKRNIPFAYAVVTLVAFIVLLYQLYFQLNTLIPRDIPGWMVPPEAAQYPIALLMPTLAHVMFLMIMHFTPLEGQQQPLINLAFAGIAPLFFYFFFMLVLPLWKPLNADFSIHVFLVVGIVGTVFFGFFLGRALYILAVRPWVGQTWVKVPFQVLVAVAFPLMGLALNQGNLFGGRWGGFSEIFGDFGHPFFMLFAIINGVLLCLPNLPIPGYRLAVFIGRSLGYTFVLYFFLVFLPFLPLAILAILAIGLGFLMLTPLALTILQSQTLASDFQYLRLFFPKWLLLLLFLGSLMVLPAGILVSYRQDRIALDQALEYVYAAKLTDPTPPKINAQRLAQVLHHIEIHKKRGDFFSSNNTPYLSFFYNSLVMNSLTLSQSKIDRLRYLFQDIEPPANRNWEDQVAWRTDSVKVIKLTSKNSFNPSAGYWTSWIDLELKNQGNELGEFADTFVLPPATYVSDYYLDMNGHREPGILAEKKAALWIYQQISTLTRRDPGILQYADPEHLSLRVYPFQAGETRFSGFSLIHPEPLILSVAGREVQLGDPKTVSVPTRTRKIAGSRAIYVSTGAKKALPQVPLKTKYHLIIDGSLQAAGQKQKLIKKVEDWRQAQHISPDQIQYLAAGLSSRSLGLGDKWKKDLASFSNQGGFFVERAIQTQLAQAVLQPKAEKLVVVLVSTRSYLPFDTQEVAQLAALLPLGVEVLQLGSEAGSVTSLWRSTRVTGEEKNWALAWPDALHPQAFLPANDQGSLVVTPRDVPATSTWKVVDTEAQANVWENGIHLQSLSAQMALYPENSERTWRQLTRNSFAAHLLTPATAFLALETESQKRLLMKKQWESLHANKSLDLGEEPTPMSEPDWWWILFLAAFWLWYVRRK